MLSDSDLCCAIIAVGASAIKKKSSQKGRKWTKQWLIDRKKYTHEKLLIELRVSEPDDFRNFLRMNGEIFDELLALVTPEIEKNATNMRDAIPASQRLSITLRYLYSYSQCYDIATGNKFEDMKFSTAVSPQSIGRIVMETCTALINCLKEYTKVPITEQEWKQVTQDFADQWNFPNCLGAIDGKHVTIKKPYNSGSLYYNYKKFFSIVMMAVANANYELIMVDVGINGRISDGGVISYTHFGQALADNTPRIPAPAQLPNSQQTLPFVFLGDDALAMTENLMKPYPQTGLNVERKIFNYRLSRARRVIENVFGILVSRFGVLKNQILLSPEKARIVVLACCYLHNTLRKRQPRAYVTRNHSEDLQAGVVTNGSWRDVANEMTPLQPTSIYRNATASAKVVRDTYSNFFNNEGQVSWQWKTVGAIAPTNK